MSRPDHLSRRERQIMDAIYRLGHATAQQVREQIRAIHERYSASPMTGRMQLKRLIHPCRCALE
jgi:predicted transcriptional regulator